MTDRPTPAEKADAADRWIEAEESLHGIFAELYEILRERQGPSTLSNFPLFYDGGTPWDHLERAQSEIWKAHKFVAVQAYDERRRALKEGINRGNFDINND